MRNREDIMGNSKLNTILGGFGMAPKTLSFLKFPIRKSIAIQKINIHITMIGKWISVLKLGRSKSPPEATNVQAVNPDGSKCSWLYSG